MSLREIKARARRDLHEGMKVPAFYYPPKSPLPVSGFVRVHSKFDALGGVAGTSFEYAERREIKPKLVFWRSEINPVREAVVMISSAEGYRLNTIDPRDGDTVTAFVTLLNAKELATFIAPDQGSVAGGDLQLPGLAGYVPDTGMMPGLSFDGEVLFFITAFGSVELPSFG